MKPTDAPNPSFIDITTLHVSGSLSAHQHHHRLLTGVANGHNCIKCTKADVQLRTPGDGQKGHETCRVVISIKLEFSASVGFINKESALSVA